MESENKPPEFTDADVAKVVGQISKGAEKEQKDALVAFVKGVFQQGLAPKDALGLTDAQMEGIYGQAYRLFNNGRYSEAKGLFRILIMLNAMEPKYTMGLAACLHMEKKYDLAIPMYFMSSQADPKNPIPLYHASDCFIQQKEPKGAMWLLEQVIELCADREEFSVIKDRAKMTLESLKKEDIALPEETEEKTE